MANFNQVFRNHGVDNMPLSTWAMVPLKGVNLVAFQQGKQFKMGSHSEKKKVLIREVGLDYLPMLTRLFLKVTGGDEQLFELKGVEKGEDEIIARGPNSDSAILKVSVHPRRTETIAFFFLQKDADGKKTAMTTLTPKDGDDLVKKLNAVWEPQANISFDLIMSDWLSVAPNTPDRLGNSNLGPIIKSASVLLKEKQDKKPNKKPIVVYFTDSVIGEDKTTKLGFYSKTDDVIAIGNNKAQDPWGPPMGSTLETLCHEIAHLLYERRGLGSGGHDLWARQGYPSDVLATLDAGNIKIPRQRVLDLNPW